MRWKIFSSFVIISSALSLSACQQTLDKATKLFQSDQISASAHELITKTTAFFQPEQLSAEEEFKLNLTNDLEAFDRIRSIDNNSFVALQDTLKKAGNKSQSTAAVRSELVAFSNNLKVQNSELQRQHFHTTEVAKIRNTVMELHYTTMTLIALVDSPETVRSRLPNYLSQQKDLIREYDYLRSEAEAFI